MEILLLLLILGIGAAIASDDSPSGAQSARDAAIRDITEIGERGRAEIDVICDAYTEAVRRITQDRR